MTPNGGVKDLDQLLAQADALIQQVDSGILDDAKEAHRLKIEIRAQELKKIKAEVQGKIAGSEAYQLSHSAEGMHEAFQEITRAMGELKRYLAGDRPDKPGV